jgi:hypothetical protein
MVSHKRYVRTMMAFLSTGAILGLTACVPADIVSEVQRARADLSRQATQSASLATVAAQQATEIGALENAMESQSEVISYLATRMPRLPTPTMATFEPTPYRPVGGSVVLEDGRCCAGGRAGEVIEISAEFHAQSPDAEIVKMRYRLAHDKADEDELAQVPWQPFREQEEIPVEVALNWVGYTLSVQFMDGAGNLSPVYHDEISIEGNP